MRRMSAVEVWRRAESIQDCQPMLIDVMMRGHSDIEVSSMSHNPLEILGLEGGVVLLYTSGGSKGIKDSLEGVRRMYSSRGRGHVDIVIINICRLGKGHNWRFSMA
jgi:hypothetical protein